MRCVDHNRDHCPASRCHVLAVCAAELPYPPQGTRHGEMERIGESLLWLRRHGYAAPGGDPRNLAQFWEHWRRESVAYHTVWVRNIATHLVSWMRRRGERRHGQLHELTVTCDVPWPPCPKDDADWIEYGPGIYHPLDTLMVHADRVAALDLVVTQCPNHGTDLGAFVARPAFVVCSERNLYGSKDSQWVPWQKVKNKHVLRQRGQYRGCGCRVAIDVNWATVAMYLDWLGDQGWTMDEVHRWGGPT